MSRRIRDYLGVVFAIFKRDLCRIVRNPVALFLIIGACALPSAYAWFCTAANWDPYQNTKNIRIAVANEDAGAYTAQTGRIDIGSEVEDELRANDELGWTFYDDGESAINSVYAGDCYAAIVIPRDFSANFASILSGDFTQPQIDYYLNEKISASAPDFTNEGADVIQEDIDQNFASTVTSTVLGITQKVAANLRVKGDAAQSALASGVERANTAIQTTRDALAQALPAIDGMEDASQSADATLRELQDALPTMKSTLDGAREELAQARDAARAYEGELQDSLSKSSIGLATAATKASAAIAKADAGLRVTQGRVADALASARGIADKNDALIADLRAFAGQHPEAAGLPALADGLERANGNLKEGITQMQQAAERIEQTLQASDAMLEAITAEALAGSNDIAEASGRLREQVSPAINAGLDAYADAIGSLSGIVLALEPAVEQSRTTLGGLSEALTRARDAASNADASLAAIQGRLSNALTDLNAIQSSATVREIDEYLQVDPKRTAEFISAPVKLETSNLYPVRNYGSGVVAFFTAVALWVAGFVFIDLFKMRVSPAGLPKFTRRQAYFGRWLLFMFLGLLPPVIVCAGDLLMGIQCENALAFMCAGIVSCLVYVNLIYALAHAFRYIGKAIAVLMLIIQIPGSSGLYPIEMMPEFYQHLHPLLPFTYTIDAFRESIGGFYGMNYAIDLCVLVFVFIPVGLFVGLVLGRLASNLTLLLDREIGRTGLFDGERVPQNMHLRTSTLLRALLHTPEYRTELVQRVRRFSRTFPKLRRAGWVLLVAQFLVTFALMIIIKADVDTKLILLMVMVIGVIVTDTYLITIAYMRANLNTRMALLKHPDEQMDDEVRDSLERRESQS